MKSYWIEKLSIEILESWVLNEKYELQFPIKKNDINKLDTSLFEYSWFIYDYRYYENEGDYGSIKIIDLRE
jgi:hypothetical protein